MWVSDGAAEGSEERVMREEMSFFSNQTFY